MKTFTGQVISTKNIKTAIVVVKRTVTHPLYGKILKKSKKYHVHNHLGAKDGQEIIFAECKPISKLKRFTILEIIKDDKSKPKKLKSKK